jgi:hypothetical protein
LPSGVTKSPPGFSPTAIVFGFFFLVFTSIVDTVLSTMSVTNAVLPSGVIATEKGIEPVGMSPGFFL